MRGESEHDAPITSPHAASTLGTIQQAQAAEQAQAPVTVEGIGGIASEALAGLKERASQALYERLGSRITDSSLEEAELHQFVKDELKVVVDEEQVPLSQGERQ